MRSATLNLFWLCVSKRQNLKLAHIQADLWPITVLTEISKDKHPQKTFITAFIPLRRADYKISAYTSLTLPFGKNQVPPMIFKPWGFFFAATPSAHPTWTCALCHHSHASVCSPRLHSPDCSSHTISHEKMNDLSFKLRVCPPLHKSVALLTLSVAVWSMPASPRDFITIWLLFSAAYILFIRRSW